MGPIFHLNSRVHVEMLRSSVHSFNTVALLGAIVFGMFSSPSFAKDTSPSLHKNALPFRVVFFDDKVPTAPPGYQVAALSSNPVVQPVATPYSRTAQTDQAPVAARSLVTFEIKLEDESLSLALRRWASERRYQLVWDAGKDFPARATTYEEEDLIGAVDQVMKDTQNSSYPLHACSYANRVIRVLHISQACQRSLK